MRSSKLSFTASASPDGSSLSPRFGVKGCRFFLTSLIAGFFLASSAPGQTNSAPVIAYQPGNFATVEGGNYQLAVGAKFYYPISFQWYRNDAPILGATASYYNITVNSDTAANYYCVISNDAGTDRSDTVTVEILGTVADYFTKHPRDQNLYVGEAMALSAQTSNSALNSSVQWFKDGVLVGNGYTYEKKNTTLADAGTYVARFTQNGRTLESDPALVDIRTSGGFTFPGARILWQPGNVSDVGGKPHNFQIVVNGTTPISYQWYVNGVAAVNTIGVGGAQDGSFSFTPPATPIGAVYNVHVVVTNPPGNSISKTATSTITSAIAPLITRHPSGLNLEPGKSGNLSVASSPAAASYRWKRNGVVVQQSASNIYYIYSASAVQAGTYTVDVIDANGGFNTSKAADVKVSSIYRDKPHSPPFFIVQPTTSAFQLGSNAVLRASALSSISAPTYQWIRNGVPLAGATAPTLTLSNIQAADADAYWVVASSSSGTTQSATANVVVTTEPPTPLVITRQPAGSTLNVGDTLSVSVGVTGSPPPTYRWIKDGLFIAGANGPSYTIENAQRGASGRYAVLINNGLAEIGSETATINVVAPITVSAGPVATVGYIGGDATLSVDATSPEALTYQWFKDGTAIPGAQSASLLLTTLRSEQTGDYSVRVSNVDGSVDTAAARLSVEFFPYSGTYRGTFSTGDAWVLEVPVNGRAIFLGSLNTSQQALLAREVLINLDGSFSFGTSGTVAAAESGPLASRYSTTAVTGQINNGNVTGSLPGLGGTLTGTRQNGATSTGPSGLFTARQVNGELGDVLVLSSGDGHALIVQIDLTGMVTSLATTRPDGSFLAETPSTSFAGRLDASHATLTGSYRDLVTGQVTVLRSPSPSSTEPSRLANLASRGLAGDSDRTMIAGFVIGGVNPRRVLIRAVGPTLAPFGVSGTLTDPSLRLFRGSTLAAANEDWSTGGFGEEIRLGAEAVATFPLGTNSRDAAIVANLAPGNYSATVNAPGGATTSGVVLLEVYDLEVDTDRIPVLQNLSARGEVGGGDRALIGGIVVRGDQPKLMLVRAVGPTLASFGVSGALANPRLRIFEGSSVIAENNDWNDGGQGSFVAASTEASGAFALQTNSADAALLIYLNPGSYTAQVESTDNTTGVALLEVYQVTP